MLHGKVQEHNLNTGRAVEFQCDKGYNLVGDSLVVCMGGNTWSSTFPTCQPKSCPTPPGWREDSARNGSRQEFHVGQSVRVACPKGQQVKGSGTITCRPDQTWSPISSVCERVSCGPPPPCGQWGGAGGGVPVRGRGGVLVFWWICHGGRWKEQVSGERHLDAASHMQSCVLAAVSEWRCVSAAKHLRLPRGMDGPTL
ncbi:complement receptor type 1 isoform X2 [Lates calcarifer]|uniref:Complement receptor type 1 isoform X2 n=1 Tax=Lates calcarifer TaxID=8187 RepID=A0AAJ8B0L3_LATCA|nr:complement receptor type 1 isoform X2 [Lates calcarifer]